MASNRIAFSKRIIQLATASGFFLGGCIGISNVRTAMDSQTTDSPRKAAKAFAPHPGSILQHNIWNHTDTVEDASNVPEPNKFIYYDQRGVETSDTTKAATRVPIVEVDIVSTDAGGHLVDPRRAVRFSITEYGPQHRELRHTSAVAGGDK